MVLDDAVSVVAAASGGTATMPATAALPGIPAAPHGGAAATGGAVMHGHGQGSSVQTPTDETEGGIGGEDAMYVVTEDDEPAVTPAVLSSRLHWAPGKFDRDHEISMRFATSSDFVIESQL